jgi:hypothetical protein
MFFNEGIALMIIAKPLKYLVNDYSVKAYITCIVIGFVMLVLIFRLALNKLTVETILKLRLFYTIYAALLLTVSMLFLYMNYIAEPTVQSVLNGISKETTENYNKQVADQILRSQMEMSKKNNEAVLQCENDPICNHIKKPNE